MDSNINIIRFPKLSNLITKLTERFDLDLSKLLEFEVQMELKEIENVTYSEFVSQLRSSKVIIENNIELGANYSSKCYSLISYVDSVIISGTILKEQQTQIKQWFSASNLSKEYTKAFIDFCNLITEGINTTFTNNIGDEINATFSQHLITPKDNEILHTIFTESEEQMVFSLNIQMSLPNSGRSNFKMFFPLELVESFYGETVNFARDKAQGRILVVDDSKTDISIIRKQLRNSSYLIVEGKDEQTALQHLFSEKIDLVLLDIYLEKENGLSLCRRIRRNMLCDFIPVVMYSWGATKDNIIKSLRAGAQDFLAKPFNKEILLKKIKKHVGRTIVNSVRR